MSLLDPMGLDLQGPSQFAPRPNLTGDLDARLGGDCLRLGAAVYPSAVLTCVCKTCVQASGYVSWWVWSQEYIRSHMCLHTCAYT